MAEPITWIRLSDNSQVTVAGYLPNVGASDSRSPILFVLGYGGSRSLPYRALLQGIADAWGVPVYVLEYKDRPNMYLVPRSARIIFGNDAQAWKQFLVRTAFKEIAEQSPTKKVTLFGYSEGAMHAIAAAHEDTDRLDRLVLIAGAGYSGRESILSIILRAARNSLDRRWLKLFGNHNAKRRIAEYEAGIAEYNRTYFGALPFWRRHWSSFRDAIVPGRVDVADRLADIQEKRRVYCLHYTKDKMLSIEYLRKRLKDLIGRRFFSLSGIHSEVLINPNETLTVMWHIA